MSGTPIAIATEFARDVGRAIAERLARDDFGAAIDSVASVDADE